MSGEQANLAAVLAALSAGSVTAYAAGAVPTPLPSYYTEVHVVERFSPTPYLSGQPSLHYWRALTRVVAKSYANAQRQREVTAIALEGVNLVVDGSTSTPLARSLSDDPIGQDDSWWSGVSEWSYAL